MMNIGIVTSDCWLNRCCGDRQLLSALTTSGLSAEIFSWEQEHDWKQYDLLLLRSPWDYYKNYAAFCQWLRILEADQVKIANGAENIIRNTNKVTQFQRLSQCVVPLIPYGAFWDARQAYAWAWKNGYSSTVVKPAISAGGYQTSLVTDYDDLENKIAEITKSGYPAIIQPFVPEISHGEVSLIYFHGRFSHAVLRHPGILAQKKAAVPLPSISKAWLTAGERICCEIEANRFLYMRIDLVRYRGTISIMEVEIAEPDLYLGLGFEKDDRLNAFVDEIISEAEHIPKKDSAAFRHRVVNQV